MNLRGPSFVAGTTICFATNGRGANVAYRHTGLGLLTPHDMHYGLADEKIAKRAKSPGGSIMLLQKTAAAALAAFASAVLTAGQLFATTLPNE